MKEFIGCISLCLLFASCTKFYDLEKIKEVQYNGDWAVPLAIGDFAIEDIIKSDSSAFYSYDSNGGIWLTFHKNLASYTMNELLPINQRSFNLDRSLTSSESSTLSLNKSITINYTRDVELDMENINRDQIDVDSIFIGQGQFNFNFENVSQLDVDLTFTVPDLTKNGVALTQNIVLAPSESKTISVNAVGYKIAFPDPTETTFSVNFTADIVYPSQATNPMGTIRCEFGLANDFNFNLALGNLYRQRILNSTDKKLYLSLFDFDEIGTTIEMDNAELRIKWENSFGVPVDFFFNSMKGTNKKNETVFLDVDNLPYSKRIINAPNNIGGTESGVIVFRDKETQSGLGKLSLKEFINKNVNEVEINGYALSNPPSVPLPNYNNFLNENGRLNLDVEFAIPLAGRVNDFSFQDTFEFDLDMDGEEENVESASIKFFSSNGFPVDLNATLVFLDSDNNYLFELNNDPNLILKSATIDSEGKSISPTENDVEFVLNQSQIEKLPKVKSIALVANFHTANNGNSLVQIQKQDRLSVKFGARVKVNLSL